MSDLPAGFVLDAPSGSAGLPPGFVLDAPKPVGAAMAIGSGSPQIGPGPRTATMPDQPRPWGDVLKESAGNFLPSVAHAGMSLVKAAIHPVDTATSLYDVGRGIASKSEREFTPGGTGKPKFTQSTETPQQYERRAAIEAPADAVGAYYANKYGSVEGFKNALATDPAGILMDASTVAPMTGVPAIAKAGAAVDPILQAGNALRLGGKGAEIAASHVVGGTTGAGASSVRAAGRAGREGGEVAQAFTENMRGQVPITDIVDRAKEAVGAIRKERADAYKAGMADVSKDKTVLDFQSIDSAVDKASEIGTFKGQTVELAAVETVQKMREIVDKWKGLDPAEFHTPEGIDALKRAVGNLRDATQFGSPERVAANRIYDAVRGEITQQAPGYAGVMESYAKASEGLKEVTKTFSLGEKATGDTAARKLQSTTRNNVQTNYGERSRLLDTLAEHDPTLPYAIAGQSMNALAPRGIVARGGLMAGAPAAVMGNPLMLGAAPAFSPRIVGEVVYFGGKAVGSVEQVAKVLGITPGRLRAMELGGYQAGRNDEISGNALRAQ